MEYALDFRGEDTMYGNPALRAVDIYSKALNPPHIESNTFGTFDSSNNFMNPYKRHKVTVHGPYSQSLYAAALRWSNFTSISTEQLYDFYTGGIYYNISGSSTAMVVNKYGYNSISWYGYGDYSYRGDVTIPMTAYDSYSDKTYNVTAIGASAFCETPTMMLNSSGETPSLRNQGDLTSVTISNNVATIEQDAFKDCAGLTSVTWGYGVNSIGANAFSGCTSLAIVTSYSEPPTIQSNTFMSNHYSTVTLKVARGYKSAYQSANYWRNFNNIQERVYDFEEGGFYYNIVGGLAVELTYKDTNYGTYSGTVNLPSFVVHNGIQYFLMGIGDRAFKDCPNLTSVVINASYNAYIGVEAFYNCPNLTSFTSTSNYAISYIGESAFKKCTGLTTAYFYSGPASLGDNVFEDCSSLTNFVSNGGFPSIPKSAFKSCVSLTNITIPNGVSTIEQDAFSGCSGLKYVTMGQNVSTINANAFNGCTALTWINSKAATPPTIQSNTFMSSHYTDTKLYVPSMVALDRYKAADYWENFYVILPNGVSELKYALNVDGGNINFSSSGTYPWTVKGDGTRVYAQSGCAGVDSGSSTMTANVTVTEESIVSFDFKAWGEGTSYDVCTFSIDGTEQFSYGARDNDWESFTATIPAGSHTLTWSYQKDGSVNPPGDYFAVDNVAITAAYTPGDVNGDQEVTIADVSALIDLLLDGTSNYPAGADVNGDGYMTIADVSALIDMLLGV